MGLCYGMGILHLKAGFSRGKGMERLWDQGKGGHASLNRRVFSGLQLSAIENTRARMRAASHLFF